MTRNQLLKILNPILAVLIVTQALSGLLADHLSHEVFEFIHIGGGITLVTAVVLHVIFNWAWIRNAYWRAKRT